MKRTLLHVLLVVLVLVEVLLATILLPESLQKPINKLLDRALPAPEYYSRVSHPNFAQEIAFLRPYEIATTVILLTMNGAAIAFLWRKRKPHNVTTA